MSDIPTDCARLAVSRVACENSCHWGVEKPWGPKLISVYPVGFVAGGLGVKVRIRIETEFGWGECRSHDIGVIERCSIDPSKDGLGIGFVAKI